MDSTQNVDLEQSGRDLTCDQFLELVEAVEQGKYTDVVMVEISRISRILATSADIIDSAVETGTTIHLLDEMIDKIDPADPMSAFFAKQLSLVRRGSKAGTLSPPPWAA